jgi:hypothetical protein
MNRLSFLTLLTFFSFQNCFSQKRNIKIPLSLKEISGLERFQDSLFIAINDSGNEPKVYFLNQKGKIIHSLFLLNARNVDWEDLTLDENNNLYIGDIGNNSLKRTTFEIYYFNLSHIFENDSITVEKLSFSYPKTNQQINTFDCESLAYYNGKLFVLIKNTKKNFKKQIYYLNWNSTKVFKRQN